MGRKIPSKKHRGVKDPLQQQARRLQSLKGKINAPPVNPDEQPVPRSLTRLFAFQHQTNKKRTTHHTNKRKVQPAADAGGGGAAVRGMQRLPGEGGREFTLRINSAVRALHHTSHPDELEVQDVKGARMAEHRERRARRRRRQAGGAGGRNTSTEEKARVATPPPPHQQPEVRWERVPFGEVCAAPPRLEHATARKGARRGLLLDALLQAGERGPRPDESAERARLDAVSAYRHLKAARRRAAIK